MSEICPYCGSKNRIKRDGEYVCTKCHAETMSVDEFIKEYAKKQEKKDGK